jgi:hypothetical protein
MIATLCIMNEKSITEKAGLKQFNARIPVTLGRNASTVAARLGLSQQDMVTMGLQLLLGSADKLTLRKAKLVQATVKEMSLPFNHPDYQHGQALAA